ncbi:MAG: hypothetical protein MR881_04405 [Bacteroidales bacterium]|nr:hypothetical protein [Bacteroidales bacterium]
MQYRPTPGVARGYGQQLGFQPALCAERLNHEPTIFRAFCKTPLLARPEISIISSFLLYRFSFPLDKLHFIVDNVCSKVWNMYSKVWNTYSKTWNICSKLLNKDFPRANKNLLAQSENFLPYREKYNAQNRNFEKP